MFLCLRLIAPGDLSSCRVSDDLSREICDDVGSVRAYSVKNVLGTNVFDVLIAAVQLLGFATSAGLGNLATFQHFGAAKTDTLGPITPPYETGSMVSSATAFLV